MPCGEMMTGPAARRERDWPAEGGDRGASRAPALFFGLQMRGHVAGKQGAK